MNCPKCNRFLPQVTGRIHCTCGTVVDGTKLLQEKPTEPIARVDCPKLINDSCTIIESITGIQHLPTPERCRACSRCTKPQHNNEVTIGTSIELLDKHGLEYKHLLPALSIETLKGPGTLLKEMLSWFVTKPENCQCADRAELMDIWGPDVCLQNMSIILNWLRESAHDNGYPYSEFVIKYTVELVINLSRLSQRNTKPTVNVS